MSVAATLTALLALAACAPTERTFAEDEALGEAAAADGAGGAPALGCVTGPVCAPDPNPCMVASCMWDGSCGAYPMPAGARCPEGVCDGDGACVEAGPPCEPGPAYPVPACDGAGLTGVCFLFSRTCERD